MRIIDLLRAHRRAAVAVLAVLLAVAGGTLAIVIDIDGPDGPAPARTITVRLNATPSAPEAPTTLRVPAAAVEQAERRTESRLADGDVPASVPDRDLADAERGQQRIRATREPLPTAGASQEIDGCRTSFIGHNWSSRNGVRPNVIVMHYTVSPRRSGWGDVDAITAYFSRPSTRASSHFVIDDEGHCRYLVPLEHKAWTQAAGNPFGVSFEIIAMGNEREFMQRAGWAKLRHVMRQVSQRIGIPLRRGAIAGCVPTRSGIVQHHDGGACWGGHHDITPFSIDEIISRVAAPVRPARSLPLTVVETRIQRGIIRPRGTGHSRRYWCQRNLRQRQLLTRLGRASGWQVRDRGVRRHRLARRYALSCR